MKKYFLDKRHGILDKGNPPSHFDEHGNFSHVKNTDISIDAELDSFYGNATGTFYLFDVVCFSSAVDTLDSSHQVECEKEGLER
jgi:hypothetical protein